MLIPLRFKKIFDFKQNSEIFIGTGIQFSGLVSENSNFQEILFEDILVDTRYSHPYFNLFPEVSIGYEFTSSIMDVTSCGLRISWLRNWVNKDAFGFYRNLGPLLMCR